MQVDLEDVLPAHRLAGIVARHCAHNHADVAGVVFGRGNQRLGMRAGLVGVGLAIVFVQLEFCRVAGQVAGINIERERIGGNFGVYPEYLRPHWNN